MVRTGAGSVNPCGKDSGPGNVWRPTGVYQTGSLEFVTLDFGAQYKQTFVLITAFRLFVPPSFPTPMATASSKAKTSGTKLAAAASPREAITDVAVKLFSEHGYTGTTMRDIATAVGMLPGSLYAHIDSKETLLVEIVQHGIERFLAIDSLQRASNEPPTARMRMAIKAHVAEVAGNPERTLVVFHQWRYLSEPNRAEAAAMRRQYALTYTRIIDEGIQLGEFSAHLDTRIAVFGILGALNWTPEWYSTEGPYSADEIGNRLADFLISGLQHAPAAAAAAGPAAAPVSAAPRRRAKIERT
jgi:TetR/AcrR family transcriptional regulator, cholesterol catabolism regulator